MSRSSSTREYPNSKYYHGIPNSPPQPTSNKRVTSTTDKSTSLYSKLKTKFKKPGKMGHSNERKFAVMNYMAGGTCDSKIKVTRSGHMYHGRGTKFPSSVGEAVYEHDFYGNNPEYANNPNYANDYNYENDGNYETYQVFEDNEQQPNYDYYADSARGPYVPSPSNSSSSSSSSSASHSSLAYPRPEAPHPISANMGYPEYPSSPRGQRYSRNPYQQSYSPQMEGRPEYTEYSPVKPVYSPSVYSSRVSSSRSSRNSKK
ncbi:uncharacterized protein F4822DRAFT_440285 [Hypoxylon trugodes]|uniref:uncharacterized protein n=1 Tax=Hypoxylon trugodes TaxID=326681 RepID=UPI00219A1ACF|nr:uncharacterized protein F4822DRAFT_440285 [Hypoxylon trugodes]KAI1384114.1 hypothetical protein F4822DRAFT_440285 [Hypoxylon trugodes]